MEVEKKEKEEEKGKNDKEFIVCGRNLGNVKDKESVSYMSNTEMKGGPNGVYGRGVTQEGTGGINFIKGDGEKTKLKAVNQ